MTEFKTTSVQVTATRMQLARYGQLVRSAPRAFAIRIGYHSKPAFMIIGAQKSGTSALASYLAKHPSIRPAYTKEIHFFDRDIAYARGLVWYHSHFPLPCEVGRRALTFDATPSYLYRPKSALRIHEYDADIKLIVLVRHPVDRAYSQWNMYRLLLKDPQSFHEAIRDADPSIRQWFDRILAGDSFPDFTQAVAEELELVIAGSAIPEPSYIRRGLYYEQITRYLAHFDLESILVIDSRSLKDKPDSVLDRVTKFLGLAPYNWSSQDFALVHARPYHEEMPGKTRALLREFYRPHNERLYELLGCDLHWE